jgi:methoxymalonate biosynthesis protein
MTGREEEPVGEASEGTRLAIIGAGVMGTGIAAMALGYGTPVVVVDVSEAILADSRDRIGRQLRHAQLLGALPADRAAGALSVSTSIADTVGAAAVIEAVLEDAAVKVKVLSALSSVVPAGTPLISNTSSIPIEELASSVKRPDELIGAHFMNPPYLVKMTEVIRSPQTSDATVEAVVSLLAGWERRAIVVRDSPGFVTSRLVHPMINDAVRLVADGIATAEAVDKLMEGCLGHRVGPLRTADLIGLDNLADSLQVLSERTGIDRFWPCELLLTKVAEGNLGRKSGRGFYDYGESFL